MKKGNFGISTAVYAAAAMVFAAFGESTLVLLALTLFVLCVEKDEWATKQCLQAMCIPVVKWTVSKVIYFVELPFSWINRYVDYESGFRKFYDGYCSFWGYVQEIISIAIFVLVVLAFLKVIKGKDANIPFVSKFANWAYAKGSKPAVDKCPNCGAPVKGAFCDKCGTKIG